MSILNAVKAARTNDRVKGGDSLFTLAKRGDAEHLEKMIDANGDAPMSEEELDEKTKVGPSPPDTPAPLFVRLLTTIAAPFLFVVLFPAWLYCSASSCGEFPA